MSDQSGGVLNAINEAASNPKVAAAVGSSSAAAGMAVSNDLITGWLAPLTTTLGLVATSLVIAIQAVRLVREFIGLRRDLKSDSKE